MTIEPHAEGGFLAISGKTMAIAPDLRSIVGAAGVPGTEFHALGTLQVATWGIDVSNFAGSRFAMLTGSARSRDGEAKPESIHHSMNSANRGELEEILPPFAALTFGPGDTVLVATDAIGFRQIYFCQVDGMSAVSTSAQALAKWFGRGLDDKALAVQSLLGWQLGNRTVFAGVQQLPAGNILRMHSGSSRVESYVTAAPSGRYDLSDAVNGASDFLRTYLSQYLDEHPDATLQLTGGQDSRILLSAIPVLRRRGLKVMTLGPSDSPDVLLARRISQRYHMDHSVHSLAAMDSLTPARAYEMCKSAAQRIEFMADPLAFATLVWAEAEFDQGPRLSGLGGEVARGFYYFGRIHSVEVTRSRVERLANWRMLANESVEKGSLDSDFAGWAREFTLNEIYTHLMESGFDWFRATDDFYLRQRMQRWAGVLNTAVCFDRDVTNPMLDSRFLRISRSLPPESKKDAYFLSRIQVELDAELAGIPLDGRPPPEVFSRRSLANRIRMGRSVTRKFISKATQRIQQANRPAAGSEILSSRIIEHWRREPAVLDSVRGAGVFGQQWLDEVVAGARIPTSGSVAMLVNLDAALA